MNHFIIAATLGLAISLGAHAQPSADVPRQTLHPSVVTPLLDNDGVPFLPAPWAIPVNPAHRTRGALYATEAQALSHERTLPGKVISVRAGCCGDQGIEDAMLDAWYQYVAYDAPRDMPVLVRGQDLGLAARLADRLANAGFDPVFLVTVP
ncbi:MAG TPA: hypothetical protein PL024_11665 [Thauera sp.]|jgi:hypothetical protein|uniref:hypothetical protein n=1 Tax=uncultured Sphingorhabdus sp. TaxID=1686106 RepID=UPI0011D84422|nr:hypothetical protein [uncultured Sphingorhabdus sp.]TXI22405.1 MAG: hypothetical protein E6Q65_01010 [Ottowia sp.]HPB23461.1 hypothetical protein [Novosphingobium sp.]HRA82148.1 hypothetical protein [Thauera sp.]